MQGVLKVLDGTGHTTVEFDTEKEGGTQAALSTLQVAMSTRSALFDATTKERIKNDSDVLTHEEVIVVPPMAGG